MISGAKILIVDDDSSHRFMLESVLGSWGYSTEEVDDGTTAVGMLRGCRYALVLMDIRMEKLSGLDAFFEIKHLARCIPVILMTVYCKDDHYIFAGICFGLVVVFTILDGPSDLYSDFYL
jgi:CheY-like chemotaxis protein